MFSRDGKYVLLFCLVYFTSYITRINYSATLIDISDNLNISDSLASLPVSFSLVSYGVGQLIAGYLGDRYNCKKIITIGLLLTATMNFLVPLSDSIYPIIFFWTVNGFAQALLWPVLVRIMLSIFSIDSYKTGCTMVVMSSSVATIVIYFLVPFFITNFSYHLVFILSGLFAVIVVAVWHFATMTLDISSNTNLTPQNKNGSIFKLILSYKLLPILFIIVLLGMLREGVTLWMPAFISDNYNKSDSFSILTTSLIPIFSIVAMIVTRLLSRKISNEILLSTYFWGVATITSASLYFGVDNITVGLITLTTLSSCMHGINLLLIGNLPARFMKYGKVSTISGILNACVYVGSTISTYAVAKIAEIIGWRGNIACWVIITLIGTILCILNIKRINKSES